MEEVRSKIFRGKFMTADGGRADPRRASIHKHMFMTSDAPVSAGGARFIKGAPISPEQRDLGIAEITRRLRAIRVAIDEVNAKARRR